MDMSVATNTQPRRAPRFRLRLPATVVYDGDLVGGLTRNLSAGGAFIDLVESAPFGAMEDLVGRTVTLTVEIPQHGVEILCEATVRWTTPAGFGVRFEAMAERDQLSLATLFAEETAY